MRKNLETEIEKGYVRLVEQMIVNVFDRIRIKKSWYAKRISTRMLDKKRRDVLDLAAWLETDNAAFWFRMYGGCTGKDGGKMLNDFKIIARKSADFLDKVEEK